MAIATAIPVTIYKLNSGRIQAGKAAYISPEDAATVIAFTDPDDTRINSTITKRVNKAIPDTWYISQTATAIAAAANAV